MSNDFLNELASDEVASDEVVTDEVQSDDVVNDQLLEDEFEDEFEDIEPGRPLLEAIQRVSERRLGVEQIHFWRLDETNKTISKESAK